MVEININTREIVDFTDKLERIHRAALPNTVRNTLNDLAFDVKKNTLQSTTSRVFTKRRPAFFRAFSGVNKATGFNVKNMTSTVGMLDKGASKFMDTQEEGGTLKRSVIAMDNARISKSNKKLVSKGNYLKSKAKANIKGKNKRAWMATVKSNKKGDTFIYNGTIFKIMSKLKVKPLYSYKKSRVVNIKPTHFMQKSALLSARQMSTIFAKHAKIQIKKWTR